METLSFDTLRQILCLIPNPKDLTQFIRVNKTILTAGDCDQIWKHYFTCLHTQFLIQDTQSGFTYYNSPADPILNTNHNFKTVFQDLKTEFSETLIMMRFFEYSLEYEEYEEYYASFFVSPTRYLTRQFDLQLREQEDHRTGEIHEAWYLDTDVNWVDNDCDLSQSYTLRQNSRLFDKEKTECDDIVNHLLQLKNLIYFKPGFCPTEDLETTLKSISNGIFRRFNYQHRSFIRSQAVNNIQRITVKQFLKLATEFPKSIQDDIQTNL